MRNTFLAAFFFCLLTLGSQVFAQSGGNFWVQIEARPTLTEAQERARNYSARLADVKGFYLGGGFYGIVLGPYGEFQADQVRSDLLRTGQIPDDSFVNDGRRFAQQFWPVGDNFTAGSAPRDTAPVVTTDPQTPDETLQQARASESRLTRAQREELQKALQWAGFYNAAIDGAFGRGTRASMESWQIANARVPTGVLTSLQRADLLDQYNAVLDDVGMRMMRDDQAGVRMQLPTAAVSFARYEPPLVKFTASGDIPQAQVLLISQRGDAGKLRGLYEVFQSLDIVPIDGPRSLSNNSFVIEGADDRIRSYTTATLADGAIKGFSLIWPAGDEARRTRILDVMLDSFERLDGTLDPDLVPPSPDQAIDMVAGLAVRQPQSSQSGFYVSTSGHVITASAPIETCTRITFDRDVEAQAVANDPDLGIAVLLPLTPQTPVAVAQLDTGVPRLQDSVAVAGFPFGGVLGAPTLTFGTLMDIRDLSGDTRINRLELTPAAGDAGGPVVDESGAVVGMLQPRDTSQGRVLPDDTSFSVKAAEIATFLRARDIPFSEQAKTSPVSSVALSRDAAAMTVLVSCW